MNDIMFGGILLLKKHIHCIRQSNQLQALIIAGVMFTILNVSDECIAMVTIADLPNHKTAVISVSLICSYSVIKQSTGTIKMCGQPTE